MLRVGWSGDASTNAGSVFSGSLSEVRIYSRALSSAEVLALSQPPLGSFLAQHLLTNAVPQTGAAVYAFACAAGTSGPLRSMLVKSPNDKS